MRYAACLALLLSGCDTTPPAQPTAAAPSASIAAFPASVRPIVSEHCVECHLAGNPAGGIVLGPENGWAMPEPGIMGTVLANRAAPADHLLGDAELAALLELDQVIPPVIPEFVGWDWKYANMGWPGALLEDGLAPGANFQGWHKDATGAITMTNDRWPIPAGNPPIQPNSYWLIEGPFYPAGYEYSCLLWGNFTHHSGMLFGIQDLRGGRDGCELTYYRWQIRHDKLRVQRFGCDVCDHPNAEDCQLDLLNVPGSYSKGIWWPSGVYISASDLLRIEWHTQATPDGNDTWFWIKVWEYTGSEPRTPGTGTLIADVDLVLPGYVYGSAGFFDYSWHDDSVRIIEGFFAARVDAALAALPGVSSDVPEEP